jgi:hypothetical protein
MAVSAREQTLNNGSVLLWFARAVKASAAAPLIFAPMIFAM